MLRGYGVRVPGSVRRTRLSVCDELLAAVAAAAWGISSAGIIGVVCSFAMGAANLPEVTNMHPRHVAARVRLFNRRLCVHAQLVQFAVALGFSLLDPDAAAGYIARKPPAGERGEGDLAALLAGGGYGTVSLPRLFSLSAWCAEVRCRLLVLHSLH